MADHTGRVLVGRYRLLEPIGSGGMGTVWRSRDEVLERTVAIKEIAFPRGLDESTRATLRERAMREARAAARLDHPGIVDVHDVLIEDGLPWIIMRYVDGRSLDRLIRQGGPLAAPRVAAIGLDLLDALGAAHAQGILHRDVKPANVLISTDDRVLLTDFGIATMADTTQLTQSGALIGSPGYIAPERLHGERPSPASDLWSLGATLYYAVEGEPAYAAEEIPALIGAVLTRQPRVPRRAGPLSPLLLDLLAKDPARRVGAEPARARLRRVADATDTGTRRMGQDSADSSHTTRQQAAPPTTPLERARRSFAPPHADGAKKKGGRVSTLILVVMVTVVLNMLRVVAFTHDGKFTGVPPCDAIAGAELSALVPRPKDTSDCSWQSGSGPRRSLVMAPTRSVRRLQPWTGTSGANVAHTDIAKLRARSSGPTVTEPGIGDEAYSTTEPLSTGQEVLVVFRVSNLVVLLNYGCGDVSADQARADLVKAARRMADSL
ncbi:serine/threonine-protein kinase [Actinoallomurus sp. NPDC050550]|uniref:serine/threonine-protein kinase n=1 Tax=Actinoallomurus sp. NPDC050550 TaxID=3154937 RepID=UPI0033C1BF90